MKRGIKNLIKSLIPNKLLTYKLPHQDKSAILLTFDDGPDETITPLVLDALDEFNARAIFFVVGYKASQSSGIVKLIAERGHIIGNHTYSHPNTSFPPFKKYKADLIRCQEVLYRLTGVKPHLYRPPRGVVSFSGLLIAASLGLRTVLWSAEGGEWGLAKSDTADVIGESLKMSLSARDILLVHDNNIKVPEILDIVLPWCKSQNIDLQRGVNALL
jgi:peptidoglycan/xylan/chitin deacetylase (PgdA/CDA1 family)